MDLWDTSTWTRFSHHKHRLDRFVEYLGNSVLLLSHPMIILVFFNEKCQSSLTETYNIENLVYLILFLTSTGLQIRKVLIMNRMCYCTKSISTSLENAMSDQLLGFPNFRNLLLTKVWVNNLVWFTV